MLKRKETPLVSIIVPVYGTAAYLKHCLDSILNQSYSNIEVIVVNDASPDESLDIIELYQKMDTRVKLVNNKKNLGLFKARLIGSDLICGKYVMFIDSDDYIGVDFIRSLVVVAEKEKADIVKAQFVMDDESQDRKYIYNYINNRPRLKLEGRSITDRYFEQEGLDFSWHVVWGKLYSVELWEKCKPYYSWIDTHLIMTEDIAYSTPFFVFAKKYVEIDCDTYFYVQRKDASTGITKNIKKFEKNISDLGKAFDFREKFLKEQNLLEYYQKNHIAWKENYGRSWKNSIKWAGFGTTETVYLEKLVKEALKIEALGTRTSEDEYFYSSTTPWSDREEQVKLEMVRDNVKCISFDIFDTLIGRPFFEPSDLFRLLDVKFKSLNKMSNLDFSKARIEAENIARKVIQVSGVEEITLDDIYNQVEHNFGISSEIAEVLKEYEKYLEVQFCTRRNFGYELYELAAFLEKDIIITSDMYLDKSTILQILEKNGYIRYKEIFLSSEYKMTKTTGNLYRYIIKEYNKDALLHIGDNYQSDYLKAREVGIKSIHLPKAISVFRGEYVESGYWVGNSYYNMLRPFGSCFDNKVSIEFWGIRCMLAVVANKFFDNPYKAFNPETDFNGDLYYMSYYALGMHLLGIVLDMVKKNRNRNKIHFVARDGYECKCVYDILRKYTGNTIPESNYLYLSRKAILPLAFNIPTDIYYIKDNISYDSIVKKNPRLILKQFLGMECNIELEKYINSKGFDVDTYFKNIDSFNLFLEALAEKEDLLDATKEIKNKIKEQLNKIIGENDILFDIGYNGTAQKILTKLLEKPIDAYYAYINKDRPMINELELGCHMEAFYDRTPCISGAIRELMFSKGEESCVGYDVKDNTLIPLLEENDMNYIEKEIYRVINTGVVDFAEDFFNRFGEFLSSITFRSYDISLPFEFLMERASDKDREIFHCCYFEDDVFFGEGKIPLTSWWNEYGYRQESRVTPISQHEDAKDYLEIGSKFYNCPRWKRVIILLLISPAILPDKIKKNLKRK